MKPVYWIRKIAYGTLFATVLACSQSETTDETYMDETFAEADEVYLNEASTWGFRSGPEPYTQEGVASYYSRAFAGRPMANGKPYKPSNMTAAHRRLPLGTKVKVINPANDSSVVVEITDRGPYIRRRIIDLSRAAANKLNFIRKGRTEVAIEVVEPADGYTVSDSVVNRQQYFNPVR